MKKTPLPNFMAELSGKRRGKKKRNSRALSWEEQSFQLWFFLWEGRTKPLVQIAP